ncbi:MAG: hypothetical protein LBE13_16090 [Bacteroidales bacterium]|nr:hypothetical protein [Bacteroidales bacterium]
MDVKSNQELKIITLPDKIEYLKQASTYFNILKNRYINFTSILFEEFENKPIGQCANETRTLFMEKNSALVNYCHFAQRKQMLYKKFKPKDYYDLYQCLCQKNKNSTPIHQELMVEQFPIEKELKSLRKQVEDEVNETKERFENMIFYFFKDSSWYPAKNCENDLFTLCYEIQRLRRVINLLSSEINFAGNSMI